MWIIGCTIVASIILYGAGQGNLAYIDALLFASGINTQAGLNPVDINKLTTFQQVVMYIFPMLTNPITLHGMVVALRLYWFEQRFERIVEDARARRTTITKSRSKAKPDVESGNGGVNGRHITIVDRQDVRPPRITNDGIVLENDPSSRGPIQSSLANSYGHGVNESAIDDDDETDDDFIPPQHRPRPPTAPRVRSASAIQRAEGSNNHDNEKPNQEAGHHVPSAITFAQSVKRSDGVKNSPLHLRPRSNTEHIAILESQRNQDEVLRIPGPRDAERGLGPRALNHGEDDDDGHTLGQAQTRDSRQDQATIDSRHIGHNPTITFEEPAPPRESSGDSVEQSGPNGPLEALRYRRGRRKRNHDDEDGDNKMDDDDEDDDDEHPSGLRRRRLTNRMPRPRRLSRAITLASVKTAMTRDKTDDMPYLSYTPTMARNSNFVGLTLEQRDELGGIEYRSLRTLAFVLLGYFWGSQLIALTFLLPYILHKNYFGGIVDDAGVSRTWWAFWTANLSFNDVGFTLTPDSMISFQTSQYILTVCWWFIIIGNTGFPVLLRFIIWVMSKVAPRGTGLWEELRFLLDHPRRCFTLLFPSGANWWLFGILLALNIIDVIFFMILDLDTDVVEHLSPGTRLVNGLFQAAATRTAGFSSLPFSGLHPAMPVLYMIMMYISVFPIAISIRRTNVYEENSLGMYPKKDDDDAEDDSNAVSYVSHHLRRQLSFDLWYVFLGFFLLAISEGGKLKNGRFDLFAVLFEVVSAYGTVGMSMGATGVNASLCSQFNVVGKLIIVALEIRGRHRGLPYGLDRAVLLPSEQRFARETGEAVGGVGAQSFARTNTGASSIRAFSGATGGVGTMPRRDSSIRPDQAQGLERGRGSVRRRSFSMDRGRMLTSLLHPGPAVHPSAIAPAHSRQKSTGSDALFPVQSGGSASVSGAGSNNRPQSFQTASQVPAPTMELSPTQQPQPQPQQVHSDGHETEQEENDEAMDGLAPLPSSESRAGNRRSDPIV